MPTIKYFLTHEFASTPFSWDDGKNALLEMNLERTFTVRESDVVISPSLRRLFAYSLVFRDSKGYLGIGYESRYIKSLDTEVRNLFGTFHISNVFGDDIFSNEAHFFGMNGVNAGLVIPKFEPKDIREYERRKICTILRYQDPRKTSCKIGGVEYDLNRIRVAWAIEGASKKRVDVYGLGFPKGVAVGYSDVYNGIHEGIPSGFDGPLDQWHASKLHILKNYHFNICMENTDYGNYITEKIWHSILGGCIPVYYSKYNKISDYFPDQSYINAAEFSSLDSLLSVIDKMSIDEYIHRKNRCIDVFNRVSARESEKNNTRWKHIRNVGNRIIKAAK